MKRNPSRSGTRSLTDELAELRRLDPCALKQRWRVLYRIEAPVYITSMSPWRISPSRCWSAGRSMLAPEIPPSS